MSSAARRTPPWTDAFMHPVRSFNTVRYLQTVQIVNRAVRVVRPLRRLPRVDEPVLLRPRSAVRPAEGRPSPFDGRGFSFLNRRVTWGGDDRWSPIGADPLWVYQLHYFGYLWTIPAADGKQLVADWMRANTDARSVAWQPYPISLRVREWIEWLLAHAELDASFRSAAVESIATQTAALESQLEFHLLGNHLLENAISLCWVGVSLAGARAERWTALGLQILRDQLDAQVLGDGTHEERSPMYQALVAEALLRLAEVARQISTPSAREIASLADGAARRLLASLACLVHPDGEYALLNDSAMGQAPTFGALCRRFGGDASLAARSGDWLLPSAGYAGSRTADGGYLAFDGGAIGPDHQPGHGHADMLSFELSHLGRRVVTDTGVGTYNVGAMRCHDRSTAAHNTIEIDGRDQCELWGAFRCARRPEVRHLTASAGAGELVLTCGYIGPGAGADRVAHTRRVALDRSTLMFTDDVEASDGEHRAIVRLHLAPDVTVRRQPAGWAIEDEAGRSIALVEGGGVEWAESRSPYHPEFGREIARPCLSATLQFRRRVRLAWRICLL